MLIEPHGGELIDLLLEGNEQKELEKAASNFPKIQLSEREVCDLELLSIGALSPLKGFMCKNDFDAVVGNMRLANGLPWSLPITLAVSQEKADALSIGDDVALAYEEHTLAVLHLDEKYAYDKELEAEKVYLTDDKAHPGVAAVYARGDVLLGGEVRVLHLPKHVDFKEDRLTPKGTRAYFAKKGWSRVVAFQTRNPIHRAHEYLQKCAMETVDGLMIHPIVGTTKGDDIPASVRMDCYKELLKLYYPQDRVLLSVFPAAMRYAGPREAIFHAIVRKNYGCSHIIIGRDHAGVGSYYGTYDAQKIFGEFEHGELGITPVFFEHSFFCKKCNGMGSVKTCPHDSSEHVFLSGTKVREMLVRGERPPKEFTRPEVADILIKSAKS